MTPGSFGLCFARPHSCDAAAFICPREASMRTIALGISIAALALLTFDDVHGQAAFPPPPPKVSPAAGVIDMHVHSHPDVFGRNMDDIDVAQLAKSRGMRGIVLKTTSARPRAALRW